LAISLDDLTVRFDHLDGASLLEDWRWLVGDSMHVALISALGDTFLQDARDGSVHLLAAGSGDFLRIADNLEQFSELLGTPDFVVDQFAPGVVVEMRALGRPLVPGQVYGYKKPPALGGTYSTDNLEPTDISVHFSLLGQILRQVRDLPPGTPISRVLVE
jgi:Domain of unknown function (DUF1851)